jgi:hypothetical protein
MKKDFVTITPDTGSNNETLTFTAETNTGNARSTIVNISGGGGNI